MEHVKAHAPTRLSRHLAGDPGEVILEIGRNGHVPTRYRLSDGGVRVDGLGRYHVDLALHEPGHWTYRWRTFGAQVAETEGTTIIVDTVSFLPT